MIGKFFQKYWKRILALLFSLIVILGISYVTSGCTTNNFTQALVAFGTLAVAVAAVWTINKTIEENKVDRKENREREERDRDERLLNEIIEWAIDVAGCRVERDIKEISEWQYRFEMMLIRSRYILNVAKRFAPSLRTAVDNLVNALTDHIELIQQYHNIKDSDEQDKRTKAVANIRNHNPEITTCFIEVVDQATTAKLVNTHMFE